ncbi:VOC family protein [Spirosoma agri]|uniref:VOC family protein n=1 Tax=Spirosoma agri TaxID=1987381 RepID=A0A6M0IH26_9BACT|nr:VOC family protein [Spirosoma agri]NEU67132.1 VOC family protein [Spirosoma agri]
MPHNTAPTIKLVPDSYTAVTPWIITSSTDKMIDFLAVAFGAEEIPSRRIKNKDGLIIHAVVKLGDAMLVLFDSRAGWGPTPAFLNIYVENIEKAYQKALELGATSVTKITPLWFGEKVCRILDPFGNLLWINQRIEEVNLTDLELVRQRSSTPEAIKSIAYIQQSLDEGLKRQKRFLDDKATR